MGKVLLLQECIKERRYYSSLLKNLYELPYEIFNVKIFLYAFVLYYIVILYYEKNAMHAVIIP